MSKDIQLFHNDHFGQLRTVIIDDEPWFVGKDVAVGDENSKTGTPSPAHTVMNYPLFISQTGANNKVIPNYGTMNLTLGKHGGGNMKEES